MRRPAFEDIDHAFEIAVVMRAGLGGWVNLDRAGPDLRRLRCIDLHRSAIRRLSGRIDETQKMPLPDGSAGRPIVHADVLADQIGRSLHRAALAQVARYRPSPPRTVGSSSARCSISARISGDPPVPQIR
jgi:hypothetical protein